MAQSKCKICVYESFFPVKSKLCRYNAAWTDKEPGAVKCRWGDRCNFAHGASQLREIDGGVKKEKVGEVSSWTGKLISPTLLTKTDGRGWTTVCGQQPPNEPEVTEEKFEGDQLAKVASVLDQSKEIEKALRVEIKEHEAKVKSLEETMEAKQLEFEKENELWQTKLKSLEEKMEELSMENTRLKMKEDLLSAATQSLKDKEEIISLLKSR